MIICLHVGENSEMWLPVKYSSASIKTSKHKNQAHDHLLIYLGQSKLQPIDLD